MEEYRDGKQEDIGMLKMKKQECMKKELLETEKLNMLLANRHIYKLINEQRKELKLGGTSCSDEEGLTVSNKDLIMSHWILHFY